MDNECPICLNNFSFDNFPYSFISDDFECNHVYCINCINNIFVCSICSRKKIGNHINKIYLNLLHLQNEYDKLKYEYDETYNYLINLHIDKHNKHMKNMNIDMDMYNLYFPIIKNKLLNKTFSVVSITRHIYKFNSKIYVKAYFVYDKLKYEYERNEKLNHDCILKLFFDSKFVTQFNNSNDFNYFAAMKFYPNTINNLIKNKNISKYDIHIILYKLIHVIKYIHDNGYTHGKINTNNIVYDDSIYSFKIIGWKSVKCDLVVDIDAIKNICCDFNKNNLLSDETFYEIKTSKNLEDMLNLKYFNLCKSVNIQFK